jgi:NADH:ubiquinone reductase (H+-translocating)
MQPQLTPQTETAPVQLGKSARPHIIVVGGGAGGLELATKLGNKYGRRKTADITLIDRARTHVWKPLLHEIAAGSMDIDRHQLDYLAQAHWHGFTYRFGEMTGIDRAARKVNLAATFDEDGRPITPVRSFTYDILVVAIGSVSNDFGTPGVKDHAITLDTAEQAERFNRRLVNACLNAHTQNTPIGPGQLHVTIIGAGATGTELSAELHRTARGVIAYGMDNIDAEKDLKITLIEAAGRILPALPERMADAVTKRLKELKVDVKTGSRVTGVTPAGVQLQSGEFIASELVVWAAGVKGPDVLANLDGLEVSRSNQLVVKPTLETTRDPNVFAMGDCCYLIPEGEQWPIPPRAQAAHQQADHMMGQIAKRLKGEAITPFKYHDFGSLVSLGHYATVGNMMGFIGGRSLFIEGLFAKLMYEVALHGYVKVALDTVSRLLVRRTEPQVKLH